MSISAIRILPAGYRAPLSCHPGDRRRRLLTNRPKLTYMLQQSVAEVFAAVGHNAQRNGYIWWIEIPQSDLPRQS
jgi:hypothetical protein